MYHIALSFQFSPSLPYPLLSPSLPFSLPPSLPPFPPKVLVLGSIRKPKKITILGDNHAEYMFLVKGGEDLRLDQRIEQVLHGTSSFLSLLNILI